MTSVFTELFLRLSKGSDGVSVFTGIPALELLGFERDLIETAWLAGDLQREGFLGFEEFILACEICARSTDQRPDLQSEIAARQHLISRVPSHPYLESERIGMLSQGAIRSFIGSEALFHLRSKFEPLWNASYRVLSILALRSENHQSICRACSPSVLIDNFRGSERVQVKRSIASTLCSVTSTNFDWGVEYFSVIVEILQEVPDDDETRIYLMGALANIACTREGYQEACFHEKSIISSLLKGSPAVECCEYLSEFIRLALNISSWNESGKQPPLIDELMRILFKGDSRQVQILDQVGIKYLCELILQYVRSDPFVITMMSEFRFVMIMMRNVNEHFVDDERVAPRMSMILSRISAVPELCAEFIGQGGIEFTSRLYAKHPLDEIVRLNFILILGHMLSCSDSVVAIPRLSAAGYKEMIKDACKNENNIEIVSRCLEVWRAFADQNKGWGTGVFTVASFLTSSHVELKLKSLRVLESILVSSEERLTFCLISYSNPAGSPTYIELILNCLPRQTGDPYSDMERLPSALRLDCLILILKILSFFAKDSSIHIARLLNQLRIGPKLYDLYPLMPSQCRELIIELLADLLIQDRESSVQLLILLRAPGQPSALDLLVSHLNRSEACVNALLSISQFPSLVQTVSCFIGDILDSMEYFVRTQSYCTLTKLSQTVVALCNHLGDSKVSGNLLSFNIADVMFRLMSMGNETISRNAARVILKLFRYGRRRDHEAVMRPSRINAVVQLLNCTDRRTKRLSLKILSLVAVSESSELLGIGCGESLNLLIQEIMLSGNMNWLGLLCHLVNENRTKVVLGHHTGFLNFLEASINQKAVSELVRAATRKKLFLNEASRRTVMQLFILHMIIEKGCIDIAILHVKIGCIIFQDINLNELGRLQPPPVRPENDHVEIIKILTGLVSLACMSGSGIPFGLNKNQFRYRSQKFKDAMQESLSNFGENILSKCAERVHLECKRVLHHYVSTSTVK